MATAELETKKAVFMRDVQNEQNENIVAMLIAYFRKVKSKQVAPCQFSPAELKKEVQKSLDDVEHGRVTTLAQLMEEVRQW